MKTVLVNITVSPEKMDGMEELIQQEYATVQQWEKDGVLEHLFLKEDKSGVFLVLKNVATEKAKELVTTLPLFPFFSGVDYTSLEKQF